ncbi:MAG: hypothetical protein DRP71_04490 [Verrucomicrobia bacterium]|nr:MAG: hypothetical protein DRP71_04490 [Verrucomicrobiota bacterium]
MNYRICEQYAVAIFPLLVVLLVAGCATNKKIDYDPMLARFFVESNPREGYSDALMLPLSKAVVPVDPKPVFSELDIVNVDLVQVDLGLCLRFTMTVDAARDLYRLSVNNLGRRLVLTINNAPLGVRVMNSPLSYGDILIFLEVSDDELDKLAFNLKSTTEEVQKAIRKSS